MSRSGFATHSCSGCSQIAHNVVLNVSSLEHARKSLRHLSVSRVTLRSRDDRLPDLPCLTSLATTDNPALVDQLPRAPVVLRTDFRHIPPLRHPLLEILELDLRHLRSNAFPALESLAHSLTDMPSLRRLSVEVEHSNVLLSANPHFFVSMGACEPTSHGAHGASHSTPGELGWWQRPTLPRKKSTKRARAQLSYV